jgi:hypothetical protein
MIQSVSHLEVSNVVLVKIHVFETSICDKHDNSFSCFHVLPFCFPDWLVLLYMTTFTFFAGPVMTKFTIALREIGTYKEVLRSQVEHQYVVCTLLW